MHPTAHRPRLARRILTASIGVLLAASSIRAADVTWTNGAGNSLWNTSSLNWSTGAWNNATFDGAIFDSTGVGNVTLAAPITVGSLIFAASGYTLGGSGPLTFTHAASGGLAPGQIGISSATARIDAPVTGTAGLQIIGTGTLTLSNSANSFTGLTPVGNTGLAVNLQIGSATSALTLGPTLSLASATVLPASTVVGIGAGVLDIGATNPTIAGLIFANTNAQNGTTGRVTGTGTLTVNGAIQVVGNAVGFGNQIAANLNIPSGTQVVRVGEDGRLDQELVFNNVISGAGGLRVTHGVGTSGVPNSSYGVVALLGNNTYTGATTFSSDADNVATGTNASTSLTLASGGIILQGAGGSFAAATTVRIAPFGFLTLDNTAALAAAANRPAVAAGNLSNRLSTSAALSMEGGTFSIVGAASAASNQQVASLTVSEGANSLTLTPGSGGSSGFSATGNFTLASGATVLFRSPTLPLTTATVQGSTAFTFAGTTPTPVGGIIVGAIGDTDTSGGGSGFVRYVSTGTVGIALLAPAEYTANFTTAGANVDVTGAQTVNAPITVNAIRAGAFTTTLNATVTVASGMILASGGATFTGAGGLAFGSNRGYLVRGNGTGALSVATPITGSAGLTAQGTATLSGNNAGLSGGIVVQGFHALEFNTDTAATAFGGSLDIRLGTAKFSVADSGSGDVNLGSAASPADTSAPIAVLNLDNAAVTTFARKINALGNGGSAAGDLSVVVSTAANTQTLSGAISLGNNLTIGGGTTGSVLNVGGAITGNAGLFVNYNAGTLNITNAASNYGGDLFVVGNGTVVLSSASRNTGSGGITQTAGTLVVSAAANLGSGVIKLRGGTFQTNFSGTLSCDFSIGADHTLAIGNNSPNFTGSFNGAQGTITKTGTGSLSITGVGDFAGNLTLGTGAGMVFIRSGGRLPNLGRVTLGQGTLFRVDNSSTNLSNRVGAATNIAFDSAGVTGGATAQITTNSATDSFTLGTLSLTGGTAANPHTSTLLISDSSVGDHTITFLSLTPIPANNTLTVSGTSNLGKNTAGGSRIFFVTPPSVLNPNGSIAGLTFTGFGGTNAPADYDPALGLIAYVTTSGTLIDNLAATSPTPTDANFITTGGTTTANLGATIKSLSLGAGHVANLLPNVRSPQSGNANAPADTLVLTSGRLLATSGNPQITGSAARLQFGSTGAARAMIDAASGTMLFLQSGVTPVTTGGLTKTGGGTFALNGASQITGDYDVQAGVLDLPQTGTTASSITGAGGTTLNLSAGTLTITGGSATTFSGKISGLAGANLTLAAAHTGTLTLTGPNDFPGTIQVNGGTLVAGSATALGDAATPVTVGSGATLGFAGNAGITNQNPVMISGTGASGRAGAIDNISGGNLFLGPITLAGPATIGAGGTFLTLGGTITTNGNALTLNPTGTSLLGLTAALNLGAGTLNKTGSGTLVLPNATNSFASVNVTGGLVQGSSAASFGQTAGATPTPITLNGGGIRYGANFSFEAGRTFTLGPNGGSLDPNAMGPTFFSVMSGPGSFAKIGFGSLFLGAAQAYAGSTTIANGSLVLSGSNFLPATTTVLLGTANSATSGFLDLSAGSQTIGGLSLAAGNTGGTDNVLGNTRVTASSLIIDGTTDSTFGGSLGGSFAQNLSLTKQGPGTQTLTGTNTYTGTTAVNAGTLALGNGGNLNGSGAVTVANGATLAIRPGVAGATNQINGPITLGATSTFTMADGVASRLNTNALTFAGGASTLVFDVGGTASTAVDSIVGGPFAISTPGGKITINGFGTIADASATYNLIFSGGGSTLTTNPLGLANTRVGIGGRAYPLSLVINADSVLLTVGAAQGADQGFWKGDQSGVWNTNNAGNTNWATSAGGAADLAALPGTLTDVIFSATGAGNLTTTLGTNTTVNSVTFTSGSGAVTIGAGNQLALNAAGVGNIALNVTGGSAARTINAPLAPNPATAQTWSNNGAFGTTTLILGGSINPSGSATMPLTVAGQGNTTVTGAIGINLTGGLIKTGSGTLTLGSASNAFTGGITVNGGVVAIAADGNLGSGANGLALGEGGTLRFTSAATLSPTRSFSVIGTALNPSGIDLNTGVTQVIGASLLSGSGAMRVSITGGTSPGILSVEGANAGFSGTIEVGAPGKLVGATLSQRIFSAVSGLILRLQNSGKLASATIVKVNNGSGLQVSQGSTAATSRILAALTFNNGRFQYDPNGSSTISDTFGTVNATGLLTLTGGATAGPAAGTTLNFNTFTRTDNATLALQSESALGQGSIGGGANAGVNYKFSGLADVGGSGTGRIVVPWAAATASTSASELSRLVTYDANGFRALTASEVVVATSQSQFLAAIDGAKNVELAASVGVPPNAPVRALSVPSGPRTLSSTGTLSIASGALVNGGALIVDGPTLNFPAGGYVHIGAPLTVQGTSAITGTGGVTTSALGADSNFQLRLTNTAANTFTGGLFINGNSQVIFTANNQLGQIAGGLNAGTITLGGGHLLFNPAAATTVSLSDSGTNRPITVNESNGTIGTAVSGAVLQIPGVISGAGQVQFGGGAQASAGGVVELTNANTYTGGTLISQGILRLSNANQLGTGPVLLNGGTLQAAANLTFATAPTLTATSGIDTGANTVTLSAGLGGSAGATGTAATTLVLAKFGSGTLEIAGDSTFAGTLTVPVGRVLLRGALSGISALTATGATARLELGAADGINDSAAVTLTGSTLATAGFSETVGALTLGSGVATLDLGNGASVFHFAASNGHPWTGTLSITNWSGTLTGGGTDQLFFGIDATGLTAGQIAGITFLNPDGFAPGTYAASLLATGELVLIPEPSSTALLLAGLSLLSARRRRRA
ncbi:MAG: fibronectin-binding autotransporter adhesin [Chthoniobacter sp.]|jgi:autotransporter-associated beta strand protein|nr:fibronectin-binding autotransporter adhesin [Chthoniobacter sp.]